MATDTYLWRIALAALGLCAAIPGSAVAAPYDDPLSSYVGRYVGTLGDLGLPGIDRPKPGQGMPVVLSLQRDGEDITLSVGGYSFAFADDASPIHLLERSEAPLIAS